MSVPYGGDSTPTCCTHVNASVISLRRGISSDGIILEGLATECRSDEEELQAWAHYTNDQQDSWGCQVLATATWIGKKFVVPCPAVLHGVIISVCSWSVSCPFLFTTVDFLFGRPYLCVTCSKDADWAGLLPAVVPCSYLNGR